MYDDYERDKLLPKTVLCFVEWGNCNIVDEYLFNAQKTEQVRFFVVRQPDEDDEGEAESTDEIEADLESEDEEALKTPFDEIRVDERDLFATFEAKVGDFVVIDNRLNAYEKTTDIKKVIASLKNMESAAAKEKKPIVRYFGKAKAYAEKGNSSYALKTLKKVATYSFWCAELDQAEKLYLTLIAEGEELLAKAEKDGDIKVAKAVAQSHPPLRHQALALVKSIKKSKQ